MGTKVTRVQAYFARKLGVTVVDPPPPRTKLDGVLDVVRRRYWIQTKAR